jgi:hypothetical protein
LAHKVHRAQRATRETKAIKGILALKACKEFKDLRARKAPPAIKVFKVRKAIRAIPDRLVPPAVMELQDPAGPLARQDPAVSAACRSSFCELIRTLGQLLLA